MTVHRLDSMDGYPTCVRRGEVGAWDLDRMTTLPDRVTCPDCRRVSGLPSLGVNTDARPNSTSTHEVGSIPMISVHLQVSMRTPTGPADAAKVAQWVGEALTNRDVLDSDCEYVVHSVEVSEDES